MIETVDDESWRSPVEWMIAFRSGWLSEYPADLELVCLTECENGDVLVARTYDGEYRMDIMCIWVNPAGGRAEI